MLVLHGLFEFEDQFLSVDLGIGFGDRLVWSESIIEPN